MMTFAMDTPVVNTQGVQITKEADFDLANATPLVYSVIIEKDSMPGMLLDPLTQFYQNLNDALITVFQQRSHMGQALQGAADKADVTELRTERAFKNGMLPIVPH